MLKSSTVSIRMDMDIDSYGIHTNPIAKRMEGTPIIKR